MSTALTVACTSDSSVAPLPSVIPSTTTRPTPTALISTTIPATLALTTTPSFNWVTVNFGTASVCSDGGVPQELWTALNCTE